MEGFDGKQLKSLCTKYVVQLMVRLPYLENGVISEYRELIDFANDLIVLLIIFAWKSTDNNKRVDGYSLCVCLSV